MGSNDGTASVGLMAESRKCWKPLLARFPFAGSRKLTAKPSFWKMWARRRTHVQTKATRHLAEVQGRR